MRTWDEDRGRPNFIMDKIWQMLQSNDTKTLNLTTDFEKLLDLAQQVGWVGPTTPREHWTEEKNDESNLPVPPRVQAMKMEGIMVLLQNGVPSMRW